MKIEYHPRAASDLNEAVAYYNRQRSGLGEELRNEVYAAIEQVRGDPLQYATVEHDIRRSLVRRFPYSVLFRLVNGEAIRVLVIRHHRRHPSFGLNRG